MGFKRKLIVGIISVLVLTTIFVVICNLTLKKEDYSAKLISLLSKQDKTTVQEVFSFDFERAYVFDDCYISGEGFAKKYNLDISIDQVKSGVSEDIQRIIFVDQSGEFVYEFKCNYSVAVLPKEGAVIYPETVILRNATNKEKPFIISFQNSEPIKPIS